MKSMHLPPEVIKEVCKETIVEGMIETNRYGYHVSMTGEYTREGIVLLTKKQAEVVSEATNPKNWMVSSEDLLCGDFSIDVAHPIDADHIIAELDKFAKEHGMED